MNFFRLARMSLFALACMLPSFGAQAQVCEGSELQSSLQYLRRMSIDLRGYVPSVEEYNAVLETGLVDETTIDTWLESEGFLHQVRNYHRALLWTNIGSQEFAAPEWFISKRRGPGFWSKRRSEIYRGARVACANRPAEYKANGDPKTEPHPTMPGARQEGWVEVNPYWAPDTTVKVCAFDAQDRLNVPAPTNNRPERVVGCHDAPKRQRCGCGPNLRWCQLQGVTQNAIRSSMQEQLLRYAGKIVTERGDYREIITGQDVEINGPISHWLQHQTGTGGSRILAGKEQNQDHVELPFTQKNEWQTIDRHDRHAGILTLPAYLLKFQTNRSRANRFYNAFLCKPFQAPESGLPASDDACNDEPNLSARCGCKYCHTALEPAAAHWGRWAEAGLFPMNEGPFPAFNEACKSRRSSRRCRTYYLQENQARHESLRQYVGMLNAYVFADEQTQANIETGPAAMAHTAIETGQFARCTVRNMWRWLMSRPPADYEEPVVEVLASDFMADGYNLKQLIKRLVTGTEYININDTQDGGE